MLVKCLEEHPDVVAAVNFNYRMNPLVQEIRSRIVRGDIGKVNLVHGSYLQDWLLYDTDYNWRLEPEICGISRCVADIGSHWMDAVQHVTGNRITKVCADLVTVIPVRKKPKGQVETFSVSKDLEFEEKQNRYRRLRRHPVSDGKTAPTACFMYRKSAPATAAP